MGAPHWILVKAFIRQATEDADYQVISNIEDARIKLTAIQRGNYESSTVDGKELISSTVGGKFFQWQVSPGLSPGEIIALAETALELIQGKTVAQARALLVRRKSTRADFRFLYP
jgi:hypothetical protein